MKRSINLILGLVLVSVAVGTMSCVSHSRGAGDASLPDARAAPVSPASHDSRTAGDPRVPKAREVGKNLPRIRAGMPLAAVKSRLGEPDSVIVESEELFSWMYYTVFPGQEGVHLMTVDFQVTGGSAAAKGVRGPHLPD